MKKIIATLAIAAAITPLSLSAQQTLEQATDSINAIMTRAKAGDATAQNEVGSWYYLGKHVNQSYEEAAQWWARSAKQNNAKATGNLGLLYQTGKGVERDSLKAMGLYAHSIKDGNKALFDQHMKLADNGSVFDCVLIGECFNNGTGVDKNRDKAIEYLTKAAKLKSTDAYRELGVIYLNAKDNAKAAECFKAGAADGDLSSTYWYGILLSDGNGVGKDEQQGANLLLKAAEAGFPMAQYAIANAYFDGKGVVKSPEKAVEWLTAAANNGVAKAQYQLALCYVNGNGTDTDFDQATEWFAVSIPGGNATPFKRLFEDGETTLKGSPYHEYLKGMRYYADKDFDNAMKQFKAVEKAKQKEGKTMQAVILANGEYAKNDIKKGVKALQDASKTVPMAMYLLGAMYEAGRGVDKDMNRAVELLTTAADAGYAPAACYLGDMYYEGRGVGQNYDTAVKYYNIAKARLTESAAKRLASCYENGYGGLEVDKKKAADLTKRRNNGSADLLKLVPMN